MNVSDFEKIYITSDTHFHHSKISLYCNRGYDLKSDSEILKMNSDILSKFDRLEDDGKTLIIHLGDFAYGDISKKDIRDLVKVIKGNSRKLLFVIGNHDREIYSKLNEGEDIVTFYKSVGFDYVSDGPYIFNKDIIMSHEPVYIPHEKTVVNIHGHTHQCNVHECYFIIDIENYDIKYIAATKDNMENIPLPRIVDTTKYVNSNRYINVCMDANDMKILSLDEIKIKAPRINLDDKMIGTIKSINEIRFKDGACFGAHDFDPELNIYLNEGRKTGFKSIQEYDQYKKMIELIVKSHFINWNEVYFNHHVLDGYYWKMYISLNDGKVIEKQGINKEPNNLRYIRKTMNESSFLLHIDLFE